MHNKIMQKKIQQITVGKKKSLFSVNLGFNSERISEKLQKFNTNAILKYFLLGASFETTPCTHCGVRKIFFIFM